MRPFSDLSSIERRFLEEARKGRVYRGPNGIDWHDRPGHMHPYRCIKTLNRLDGWLKLDNAGFWRPISNGE